MISSDMCIKNTWRKDLSQTVVLQTLLLFTKLENIRIQNLWKELLKASQFNKLNLWNKLSNKQKTAVLKLVNLKSLLICLI